MDSPLGKKSGSGMRLCPLCQKPAALLQCCPLGKIEPSEWEVEQMTIFLDVLRSEGHKWTKLGFLGDMVDASLADGGYKELFKKERLVGKQVFGKQRKTISDMMKRIGIKNVKHRDLLVECIFDLSKPLPPQSNEELMAAKFTLIRNTWSTDRRPDIQLHAMSDILAASADESQHKLLDQFGLCTLLSEIINGNMMDSELEKNLRERQQEIDDLWKRRRKRELDYEQKKDLDKKEHLQARDWLQWKADFGSLAVAAFATLQNISKMPVFTKQVTQQGFPDALVLQLDRCRDAEKHLTLLKAMSKGQYMSLVASEVAEQQLLMLNIIYNLSLEPDNRSTLCKRGVAAAVVRVANSPTVRDTPRYLQCIRIFCNLSIGKGETEARMVKDGVMGPVSNSLREGHGEIILYAISTIQNLAFVVQNRDPIIDSGVLILLTQILKEEKESPEKLKALDAVRNLAAARADLRFARIVVDELMNVVKFGTMEERLRALIALRSIVRFEETLQICEEQGVMRQALTLMDGEDARIRTQAIGLLINVIGFSASLPMDADEEDELSDSELFSDDEESPEGEGKEAGSDSAPNTESLDGAQDADGQAVAADLPAEGPSLEDKDENEDDVRSTRSSNFVRDLHGSDRPLRRSNKLLQMRVSPLLRLFSERELEMMALESEYFIVNKDEALVVQGDRCDSIYVVVKGILRVLIGAKGAGKWGMYRIDRKKPGSKPSTANLNTHMDSPSLPVAQRTAADSPQSHIQSPLAGSSPAERTNASSPLSSPLGRRGKQAKGKKTTAFRAGKDTKEVSRLRPGDTACELCMLEGRACMATLVGMSDRTIVVDISAKLLSEIWVARPELKDAITPGEMVFLTEIEKVRRYWKHPSMSDDAAEKSNLFRIESSERKTKLQRHLLAIGALEIFERNVAKEEKMMLKTMLQIGLTLLIGGAENKDSPLLHVGEELIEELKEIIQCSRHGEDFCGHFYKCDKMMLCMRLLAMNDFNKKKFVRSGVIPFVLDFLKEDDQDIVRLATAILLELSFGMQARWLLRPILGIWNKFVKGAKHQREIDTLPPPLTDTVDIAAPTHLVQIRGLETEPTFAHELHEAAFEGGQQWIERLVEEEGVAAGVADQYGGTAMHFAVLNARFEAINYLMDKNLDINVPDASGCTPLAWYIMSKNIEHGTDQEEWPGRQ